MNWEWAHRLATMAGNDMEFGFEIQCYLNTPLKNADVASRAAWCVGYDRFMDHATKAQ